MRSAWAIGAVLMCLTIPARADVADDWTAAVAADRAERAVALATVPLHVVEAVLSEGSLVHHTEQVLKKAEIVAWVHELARAKALVGRVRQEDRKFSLADGRQLWVTVDAHGKVATVELLRIEPGF